MRKITSAALLIVLTATPAFALTAADVMDKMTEKERAGYLAGAVEMAMVMAPAAKAECIVQWYFAPSAPAQAQIVETFNRYKDKPAAALISALINRACP